MWTWLLTFKPHNCTTSRVSQGHSVYQFLTLWDHSLLSYATDKQMSNRQTDRQTEPLERLTHADRHSVGNEEKQTKIRPTCALTIWPPIKCFSHAKLEIMSFCRLGEITLTKSHPSSNPLAPTRLAQLDAWASTVLRSKWHRTAGEYYWSTFKSECNHHCML